MDFISKQIKHFFVSLMKTGMSSSSNLRAAKHYEAGLKKYEDDDFHGAMELFSKAINEDTNNAWYLYARGLAASQVGKLDVAQNDFERAIELDGNVASFHYALGSLKSSLGLTKAAITDICKTIKLLKDTNTKNLKYNQQLEVANYYYALGLAYDTIGEDSKAIKAINHALTLKQEAEYYYAKGNILYSQVVSGKITGEDNEKNALKLALEALDNAIDLNGETAHFFLFRSLIHRLLGKFNPNELDKSTKDWEKGRNLELRGM